MPGERLLVPISRSPTVRATVEYAVELALSGDEPGHVRFVFVYSPEAVDTADEATPEQNFSRDKSAEGFLHDAEVWAREDAGDADLSIETGHVGDDEYLFSPGDVAASLAADAREHGIDRIVVDPEYDPGVGSPFLRPLEVELVRAGLDVVEAPVEQKTRRTPLIGRSTPVQIGALFGLSFVFYQLLAGRLYWFDLVTGAVSATIVAVGLSRVSFSRDPDRSSPLRLVRMGAYVPYLLVEIVKSNVQIAAVILHPRLPIEPRLTRVRPAVWGGLPVTTLANSITLTPGTLTVRSQGRTLTIHTLIPDAREDLFDGALERAVRFVFYGRRAMRIDSPRDRGETEILQPPESEAATDGGRPGQDDAVDSDAETDHGGEPE